MANSQPGAVPEGNVPDGWVPDWNPGSPFAPYVNTFTAALCALPMLTDPKYRLPERGYSVGFTGRVLARLNVHIDRAQARMGRELSTGTDVISLYFNSLTGMLMNACYEAAKNKLHPVRHPVIQFFKHVRNGVSHGNCFHFQSNEPKHPAAWRGLVIDHASKGKANPLHGTPVFAQHGLLHSADGILLLADIEKLRFGGSGGQIHELPKSP